MEPGWFKSARIYQILIDRFAGDNISYINKPGFLGGDLKGIIDKLDYINGLGINTIWLSPFWSASAYHGYHITNYEEVDWHFGTMDDLKDLVAEAHARSIKVITDFVPNHCSSVHPYFTEAQSDKSSRYYPWFYFKRWPDVYRCFLDVKELPKINLDNPDACNYIINIAKFWLSTGIDGYRIDHIIGPSHKFWKIFRRELKNSHPSCVLFGEAWGEGLNPGFFETINIRNKLFHRIFGINQESLQREYYGEMDGVLDFTLNNIIKEAAGKGKGFTSDIEFRDRVIGHFRKYKKDYSLVTFLDNHDMNRFLFYCDGNFDILLEGLEFLLTLGRPVVIYYGTETGMNNELPVRVDRLHSDLNVREPVDWKNIDNKKYEKVRELLTRYPKE